jgi:enoyl-CoA hydratase
MTYDTFLYEKADQIAVITFNRPHKRNAINERVLEELSAIITDLTDDAATRIVILTGSGTAFSAGADFEALGRRADPAYMANLRDMEKRRTMRLGHRICQGLEKLEQIVIAALNGFAIGGGWAIAMACDLRIAAEGARFWIPETRLGVPYAWGSAARLVTLVGPAKAKELILTCDEFDAQEALRLGLVNQVVPPEKLLEVTYELARKILDRAPMAVTRTKQAINAMVLANFGDLTTFDADLAMLSAASPDAQEALAAFHGKRRPKFTGK